MKRLWRKWHEKLFGFWNNGRQGATEAWSPLDSVEKAKMVPFDDVDEWLATRLSEYSHKLVEIDKRLDVTGAMRDFIADSMRNKYYRRMLQLDIPTAWTKRDAEELNNLLKAELQPA